MAEEKILERIRKMLELANDERNHEGERQTALLRAQQLMDQHRIDMAMLSMKKGATAEKPIAYEVEIPYSRFSEKKYSMLYYIAEHCGVRSAWKGEGRGALLVGMRDDIEVTELLYTLTMLEFDTRIDPVWDREKSFDANVKALQEAGKKWVQIARMANLNGGNPRTGQPGSETDGSWLKSAYRRECKRLGEEPRRQTQRHEAYQESFASSFLGTIYNRLEKMRRDADDKRGGSFDRLPAIMSVQDRVNAEYWRLFPHLHPEVMRRRTEESRKREEERRARMTQAERDAEDAQRAKWTSKAPKTTRYDEAGWAAGDKAAQRVDLLGGKNRVKNQEAIG